MATLARLNVILGLQSKQFSRGLDRAQYKLRRFGNNTKRTGRTLTTSLTVPTVAAGAAAVKMAVDYETSMTKIVTLVGISQQQVDAWGKEILELAPKLGKAPRELAEGLFFVSSAGFRGAAAIEVLTKAAEGSNLGLGETAVVADAVTSAINAYGKANLNAADATAILRGAVQLGKAEAESIAPVLGQVVPIASQMGVSFREVAGGFAAMSLTGTPAAQAATQISSILTTIAKGSDKTRKGLKSVGTSLAEIRGELREKGLLGLLQSLAVRFGDNEDAVSQVFGNVNALRGVFGLVGKNAAEVQTIFASLAKVTGEDLNGGLAAVAESSGKKFANVLARIQVAAIQIGAVILPVLLPAVERFGELVGVLTTRFGELSPGTQKLILGLIALTAAAGPVLIVVGLIATGIGTITAGFLGWSAAIGVAAAILAKNWEKVSAGFRVMLAAIKPALLELREFVLQIFEEIRIFAAEVWPIVQELAGKAIARISELWEKHGATILRVLRNAWNVAKLGILGALKLMTGAVETFLHVLNADWPAAWKTVKDTAEGVFDTIGRVVRASLLRMRAGFFDFAAGAGQAFARILGHIRKVIVAWTEVPFINPAAKALAKVALDAIDVSMGAIAVSATAAKLEAQGLNKQADKLLTPVKKASDGLVQMQSEWVTVGVTASKTVNNTKIEITRAGKEIQGKLRGGFGKGIKEGAEDAKVVYNDLQSWVEAHPLKVRLDMEDFHRQIEEAGAAPDTSGSLP